MNFRKVNVIINMMFFISSFILLDIANASFSSVKPTKSSSVMKWSGDYLTDFSILVSRKQLTRPNIVDAFVKHYQFQCEEVDAKYGLGKTAQLCYDPDSSSVESSTLLLGLESGNVIASSDDERVVSLNKYFGCDNYWASHRTCYLSGLKFEYGHAWYSLFKEKLPSPKNDK
jgi:hypothetical protein